MNETNTIKLKKEFPNLYNSDFSFDVKDGWFDIIYELSQELNAIIERTIPMENRAAFQAVRVKEKFGVLRFYMESMTEQIEAFVSEAEAQSAKICEICGDKGKGITNHGWFATRCEFHEKI